MKIEMHREVNEWLFDVGCGKKRLYILCIYIEYRTTFKKKQRERSSILFRVEVKNGKSRDKFEIKNEQFVKFVKWSKHISWAQHK